MRNSSPGRTGRGQRNSSAPAPTMPPAGLRSLSTRSRMVTAAVCQPLAASPRKIVSRAASSSRWNGCGSNSAPNVLIRSVSIRTRPERKVCPTAKSSRYLYAVGPFYGLFGLGLALYFASQGAGRLLWPLLANLVRLGIAAGGGWLALHWSADVSVVFAALGAALAAFGLITAAAVATGAWFGPIVWSRPRVLAHEGDQ